jgi:hypothetical protein
MGQGSVRVETRRRHPCRPFLRGQAEVAAFAQVLTHEDILKAVQDQVRFARVRFGTYDLIDFAVVLIGHILSDEPTSSIAANGRLTCSPSPV